MSTAQIPGLLSGSEIVSCLTKYAKSIVVTTQDAINIGQELLNRGDIVAVTLNAQTFVESNKSLYRISERIELTENEQQNFCPWRIVNGTIRGTEECDISGYVHKRILQNSKEQKIRWAKLLSMRSISNNTKTYFIIPLCLFSSFSHKIFYYINKQVTIFNNLI